MVQTITLSDEVFSRLQALARPFKDREPEDVIRRLLDGDSAMSVAIPGRHDATTEPRVIKVSP